ncbi:Very-long-chain [Meloidogyne graminicola]|uniref:Very-long-chain (3R)-3-hydroxyacyl-CoA dehydratase n=1 Tax=Meloidogyne graminicola TaxID=189291 RepID=A0A8S9ZID3_9BILA|nr:Very-long-chain [Meloidogyne graminicola]
MHRQYMCLTMVKEILAIIAKIESNQTIGVSMFLPKDLQNMLFQVVFLRVTVVWFILHKVASSRLSVGLPMLLTAWSVTEVIRYSFYALNLINAVPWILIWMRYTFFILLYPLGAGGELLTMFAALPEIAERKHFTLKMPNKANFAFNFYWIVILFALTYIPLFPQLYGYMFIQRKKVLGGNDSNKEKKAE